MKEGKLNVGSGGVCHHNRKVAVRCGVFCVCVCMWMLTSTASLMVSVCEYTSMWVVACSVTRKKLPNVYKSCPKMISLEK